MTGSEGGAPAGWYPDPHHPGQLRWFDGELWTEHRHTEGTFPDVGSWMNATFGMAFAHIKVLGPLAFAGSFITAAITMLALHLFAGDAGIVDDDIVGFGASNIVAGSVALLVAWFATFVVWIAVARYLQRAHLHASPTIGDALQRGVTRVPLVIGVGLAYLVVLAVAAVLVGVAFVIHWSLGVLSIIALVGLALFAVVKLAFLGSAIAAAPTKTNIFAASASVSSGRFMPIVGRLIVLFLLVAIGGGIINAITGTVAQPVDQTLIEDAFVTVDGETMLLRDIRFDEFLPSAAMSIVWALLASIGSAFTTIVSSSGLMRLYLSAGAPSDL